MHIAPALAPMTRIGMANGLPGTKVDNQGNLCGGTPWDGLFCKDADPLILKTWNLRAGCFRADEMIIPSAGGATRH